MVAGEPHVPASARGVADRKPRPDLVVILVVLRKNRGQAVLPLGIAQSHERVPGGVVLPDWKRKLPDPGGLWRRVRPRPGFVQIGQIEQAILHVAVLDQAITPSGVVIEHVEVEGEIVRATAAGQKPCRRSGAGHATWSRRGTSETVPRQDSFLGDQEIRSSESVLLVSPSWPPVASLDNGCRSTIPEPANQIPTNIGVGCGRYPRLNAQGPGAVGVEGACS